jgi:hypothetical protein
MNTVLTEPGHTVYIGEIGFSNHTAKETRYRKRLKWAQDLRIQLSSIRPNLRRVFEEEN